MSLFDVFDEGESDRDLVIAVFHDGSERLLYRYQLSDRFEWDDVTEIGDQHQRYIAIYERRDKCDHERHDICGMNTYFLRCSGCLEWYLIRENE